VDGSSLPADSPAKLVDLVTGLWVGADSTYTYLYNIYHTCCAVLRGSILCIIVAVIAF